MLAMATAAMHCLALALQGGGNRSAFPSIVGNAYRVRRSKFHRSRRRMATPSAMEIPRAARADHGDPTGVHRISVIVRCHQQGRFLAEAVGSAREQSRPPDEIVVVNDGSDDETAHVLAGLKDSGPLIVVENPVALGPAMSFNFGVSASTGSLLLALDADDALSPRFLELTERAILRGADLAYGGVERFGNENGYEPPREFDADELGIENFIYVSTLFRRSYFDLSGGFKPDLDRLGLEDWEFWLAAVEGGARGHAVEGCWMRYRRHPEGSRNSIRRSAALSVHLRMRRLHPGVVSWWHLARWAARSIDRNLHGRRKVHS